jgi:hypothetical protein
MAELMAPWLCAHWKKPAEEQSLQAVAVPRIVLAVVHSRKREAEELRWTRVPAVGLTTQEVGVWVMLEVLATREQRPLKKAG